MSDSKKSLATAHAMRKAASKKKPKQETGVHSQSPEKQAGTSQAGMTIREGALNTAKEIHKDKLQELKDMPKPKLAEGGMIKKSKGPKMADSSIIKSRPFGSVDEDHLEDTAPPMKHDGMSEDIGPEEEEFEASKAAPMLAEGGEVPEDEAEMEHAASIAAGVMARRAHKQFMAVGGMVNNKEDANGLDDLNEDALKENYDDDFSDEEQPEDSNEHGDSREASFENKKDRVSAIMKKRKSSPITK